MCGHSSTGDLVSLALLVPLLMIGQANAYTHKSLRTANVYREQQEPQGDSVFAEPGLDLEDGKWFQPLMADMEMDENMSFDFDDNDFEEPYTPSPLAATPGPAVAEFDLPTDAPVFDTIPTPAPLPRPLTPTPVPVTMAPTLALKSVPTAATVATAAPITVCMNDIPGVGSPGGYVCCKASCGVCGGEGCSVRGLASDCCVTEILSEGDACADTNESPCYIGDPTADSSDDDDNADPVNQVDGKCSNGLAGLQSPSGQVCCGDSCGQCGGEGCSSFGTDCCVAEILDSGDLCSVTNTAPCIIFESYTELESGSGSDDVVVVAATPPPTTLTKDPEPMTTTAPVQVEATPARGSDDALPSPPRTPLSFSSDDDDLSFSYKF